MTQEQTNFISYCQGEREKFVRRFIRKPRDGRDGIMASEVVICMDNMINELTNIYNSNEEKPTNN